MREHPEAYSAKADVQLSVTPLRDQITAPARTILLVLLAAAGGRVRHRLLERRQSDPGALGAPRRRAGGARRARRQPRRAAAHAAGREPGAVRRRRRAGRAAGAAARRRGRRYAARFSVRALEVTVDASLLWVGAGLAMAAAVLLAYVPRLPSPHAPAGLGLTSGSVRITPGTNRRLRVFATTQIAFSFVLLAGAGMLLAALVALQTAQHRLRHAAGAGIRHPDVSRLGLRRCEGDGLLSGSDAPHRRAARRRGRRGREASCRGATPAASAPASSSPSRATRPRTAKRIRTRGCGSSRPASSPCSASRSSPAATSPTTTAAAASRW